MPICTRLHFERFFVRHQKLFIGPEAEERQNQVTRTGLVYATPAFLCLAAIEIADLAFAFDSVPAVIAVTQEPLRVYAAMIFAILGLRSLYFVLAALTRYLIYLEKAVIVLLFYIAAKMALQSWNHAIGDTGLHIASSASLTIVLGILALGVLASLVFPRKRGGEDAGAS